MGSMAVEILAFFAAVMRAPLVGALILTLLCLGTGEGRAESWDVSPRDNAGAVSPSYCPQGNARVEPEDALVTLRRAVNLVTGFTCFGEPMGDDIVDVAPAVVDNSTIPPTFTAVGEGRIAPEDALLILRAAVGLIELVPPPINPKLAQLLDTVPTPSLGDVNANPPGDFPGPGDVDCDGDGEFDPVEDTVLRVAVETGVPASDPYDICIWFDRSVQGLDFDVSPPGLGPEDHDGDGNGRLDEPPDPDVCATVCPEGSSDSGCAVTESSGQRGAIVNVGPFHLVGPPNDLDVQQWAVVVDPHFALADDTFADNLRTADVIVRQCPPLSPDLLVDPFFGIRVVPPDPSLDDDLSLRIRVENEGDLPVATLFQVDLYVDPESFAFGRPMPGFDTPTPEGDSFKTIAASPQFPLGPGQMVEVEFTDFDPAEPGVQPLRLEPGLHAGVVLVDSAGALGFGVGAVKEFDEQNNVFPDGATEQAARFCVGTERGFGRPDLAVSRVRFFERGGDEIACHRQAGDVVDVEVTIANLDDLPEARDLNISPGGGVLNAYQIVAPGTGLDGFLFDCAPAGAERAPLRALVLDPLSEGDALFLELTRGSSTAPSDVNSDNNLVQVPLLNQPPTVDAGSPISDAATDVPQPLAADVNDPNDVPPGSHPASYDWIVESQPKDSTAEFDDPAREDPLFTADTTGAYTLRLTVTDCPGGFTLSDTVEVTVRENDPPSASAGGDFSVPAKTEDVALDGSASSDPDPGDVLSFQWTQTGGSEPVAIDDATRATATFTAPEVSSDTALVLTFELAVTDLGGNSDTDEIEVTVAPGGDPQ